MTGFVKAADAGNPAGTSEALIRSNISPCDGLKLAAAGLADGADRGSGAAIVIGPAASSANQRAAGFQPNEAHDPFFRFRNPAALGPLYQEKKSWNRSHVVTCWQGLPPEVS
jgi:hypothetical protein